MIYIIIASLLYTAGLMFGSYASRHGNSNLISTVLNIVTAIIPIAIVAPTLNTKLFADSRTGIIYAVVAGAFIALFTMALTKSFSINKVGVVTPILYGSTIFLTTILSYFFFQEKISKLQFVGLLFLAFGFGFIIYARWTGR